MNLQLPPNNPFLFIPTKKQVTHGKGIAPQAHTHASPSIFPYLRVSSLFPAQASRVCSSSGMVGAASMAHAGSLRLQLPGNTPRQPPALSLTTGLLYSRFSLPTSQTFPKQLPRRGLSSWIPLHPSQPRYLFLSGEWFLCKPLFSLSCLASVATPVLPLLTLNFQLATKSWDGKAIHKG